jgi:hypothetical protein
MSRYLLLFLLNLPFILAGLLSTITQYKLQRISRLRAIIQTLMWLTILVGLSLAHSLYEWLFAHNLTATEPLSLFDVVQITAIVFIFYIAHRTRSHVDTLEHRLQDLHQELSIKLSERQ